MRLPRKRPSEFRIALIFPGHFLSAITAKTTLLKYFQTRYTRAFTAKTTLIPRKRPFEYRENDLYRRFRYHVNAARLRNAKENEASLVSCVALFCTPLKRSYDVRGELNVNAKQPHTREDPTPSTQMANTRTVETGILNAKSKTKSKIQYAE